MVVGSKSFGVGQVVDSSSGSVVVSIVVVGIELFLEVIRLYLPCSSE